MLEERFDILLGAKKAEASFEYIDDHGDYHVRQARAFSHTSGLSEQEIMHALGHFCSDIHTEKTHEEVTPHLVSTCQQLLTQAVMDRVEETVFQHGTRALMHKLCVEITGVCDHHTLIDRGEL
jgi:hypothetical protein